MAPCSLQKGQETNSFHFIKNRNQKFEGGSTLSSEVRGAVSDPESFLGEQLSLVPQEPDPFLMKSGEIGSAPYLFHNIDENEQQSGTLSFLYPSKYSTAVGKHRMSSSVGAEVGGAVKMATLALFTFCPERKVSTSDLSLLSQYQ